MTKKNLQIHSENILPIIKKWLYSEKNIFIRELVSNACDAIYKLKILRDQGAANAVDEEFRIDIDVDKEAKTLRFTDTGIGMDSSEIEKYIAQIAFSGAEEFVEKYNASGGTEQMIGHFGLGFYSSYMVAKKVEIDSLSYKEGAQAAFWSCDGSNDYDLGIGKRTTRGTEITLYIDDENAEFLDEAHLKEILKQYCSFLPYPIYLNGTKINEREPLWIKKPSECSDQDYLEFYRYLYPMEEDPLFWIHLNVDYPFHLQGILYFPKMRRDFDLNKTYVKLYCNRVYVSDNCKDLIPNYLTVLRGIIDSPDIPLNVSRSYLQMDKTVRQLSQHISKKVSDSLTTLNKTDHEKYLKCWPDASLIVKLGVLEDDKFYDRVKGILLWKSLGGEWMTAEDYLERNRAKTNDKIFYVVGEEDHTHFVNIYKNKGIDILCLNHYIDTHLIHQLESKLAPAKFQRIDAALDETLLDKEREKSVLDAEGKTEAGRLADLFRNKLGGEHLDVEAKSLASDALPGFIMIDEHQRRMRDYMRVMAATGDTSNLDAIMGKRTFVINTNNPLISAIAQLDSTDSELATEMAKQVYEQALLSQRELDPKVLQEYLSRTTHVLEQLSEKLIHSRK